MLIDAFADEWLTDLLARSEGLPPLHRLYLLVDGAFVPGLHRLLAADLKALLFEPLPGCSTEAKDVSPFITPFAPHDKSLTAMLKRCNRWPMVSMIETSESLRELADRLAAWCVVEADGQRFNLRFPDTRRLPAIFKALNEQQRAQIAGPAVRWSYTRRDGRWGDLEIRSSSAGLAQDPVLDQSQFARLVDDSRVDELLSMLSYRGCEIKRHPSRSYELVNRALGTAARAGLGNDELVGWCEWFWRQDALRPDAEADLVLETWIEKYRG
jgi:hypothetical protein